MAIELRVPALGESITQATVGAWLKKEGDQVQADEPLVEVESEKATVALPANVASRSTMDLNPTASRDDWTGMKSGLSRRCCSVSSRMGVGSAWPSRTTSYPAPLTVLPQMVPCGKTSKKVANSLCTVFFFYKLYHLRRGMSRLDEIYSVFSAVSISVIVGMARRRA